MITDEELDKGLLTLHIIWFAMLMSLAIYLFVGLLVKTTLPTSMDENTFTVLKRILYAVAVVILFITKYIKNLILNSKVQIGQTPNISRHSVLQKYTIAMVITWALSESIGIYGLVLFFLGKNAMDLYVLISISAVAMAIYRPRKDEIISLDQKSREGPKTGGAAA